MCWGKPGALIWKNKISSGRKTDWTDEQSSVWRREEKDEQKNNSKELRLWRKLWDHAWVWVHNQHLHYLLFPLQIYIFENNIYYQSDVRSNSLRITSSGMEGVIFNGLADWLYEGVFGRNSSEPTLYFCLVFSGCFLRLIPIQLVNNPFFLTQKPYLTLWFL